MSQTKANEQKNYSAYTISNITTVLLPCKHKDVYDPLVSVQYVNVLLGDCLHLQYDRK